jgi:hypothetical protein
MSIKDFRTQLEAGKEDSLFVALARLSRLGTLKDLVLAATTESGWAFWSDASPNPAQLAEAGA